MPQVKMVAVTLLALFAIASSAVVGQEPAGGLPPEVAEHGFADMVLVNGKIVSMDDAGNNDNPGSIHQAMAVKKGRIVALGADEYIRTLASGSTQVIDLKGKTVIPGIVETHSHIYGIERWAKDVGIPLPRTVSIPEGDTVEETRKNIQDTLKKVAEEVKPGDWIVAGMVANPKTGRSESRYWASEKRLANREFLDGVTRRHPVLLRASTRGFINTAAIELANDEMHGYSDFIRESMGKEADLFGQLGSQEMAALQWEIFYKNQPVEKLAEAIRRTMETYAAHGWTTFSTRLPMPSIMSAFTYLNRNGRMPIRLGGHFETHRRAAPPAFTRAFYEQTGDLTGLGSDHFWITGVASERWDALGPEACLGPDVAGPPEIKKRERCPVPGGLFWDVLQNATRAGWRPAGVHGVGSHGVRLFIQMLEGVMKQKGWTAEDIRRLRPTVEHAMVVGTEGDVIAKLKEYGIIVSAGPGFVPQGFRLMKDYGPALEKYIVPVKTLMDAGVRVVGQLEASPAVGYNLWLLITRKVGDVQVNKNEAIDRVRALKMWTKWAGEYVARENDLGSLEKGKLADFVILDRDYFTIEVDDIRAIVPLMTVVGGKTMFLQRNYATELGVQPVGFQPETPRPWDARGRVSLEMM